VDSPGYVGEYTSLAFDASGRSAISYYDASNGAMKLAYDRNNDRDFLDANEISTVDSNGTVGLYSSLAFVTGPAIGYYDYTNGDVKLAYDRNSDGDFSDTGEIVVVDEGGVDDDDVGQYLSLAFDSSGYPAISYLDVSNRVLKFAYDRNGNGNFSDTDEIIVADDGGIDSDDVGLYTSLAFDASGKPAISYYDWTNRNLKLAYDRNGDGTFSPGDEITIVDSGFVGEYTSLAFDSSERLAISYRDRGNSALNLAYDRNNDGDFLDANEIIIVDSDGYVGMYSSLAFDSVGNPAISYSEDFPTYDLKFAHDYDGSGDFEADEITVVDSDNDVGFHSSLAFDASGQPAISHHDDTNIDLKLARYSPTAAIIVSKTADPTSVLEEGENVQFTINVTNSGKVDVTLESLTDSVFDLSTRCSDATGTVLASGESYACTFTEFLAGSIGDPHQNTATVNASDDEGNWDTDDDTATGSFTTTKIQVFGVTREVTCDILPGVEIWLGGTGPVFSSVNGTYEIVAPETGTYNISAAKEGFRDRVRTEYIEGPDAVNINFQAGDGLIPCSPDIWYALECVNLWLYPPGTECDLGMNTVLAVMNAWMYPGCP
jgi:uncharacterized repeat protein (TIGR01451 family)